MHRLYTLIPLSRSCSSVWLERLPVTQEVAGSNPVSSAKKPSLFITRKAFFLENFLSRDKKDGKDFSDWKKKKRISPFCVYHEHRLLLTDLLL